jgi:type VI secretion system protein ImpL
MMSLRRIFGLILLFFFFEAVVAVVTTFFFADTNVLLACLAMTGLAVGTWIVFVLLTRFLSKQRAPKAAASPKAFVPATMKASPGGDSFTLEFTALMNEANRRLQTLASVDGQRQPPTVSSLPLYLVIGAEGSGKTTAIVNSGLEPRLLAGEAQKDGLVIPTALANLWFAEGAIFAEIAGSVLMQEPDRWEKALQILGAQTKIPRWKRLLHRNVVTRTNLRGVVLACDTELFVHSRDVHRLGSVARTINERLQSVQAAMRADFPTYVLLTRCDSVLYFQEFFSQLSEAESRRILGVTLPYTQPSNEYANVYSDREGSRLTKFLNRLYQSVADKRIVLLAREEIIEKRASAYEFPRELKKIRGELVQFLLDAFRPSTLHTPCRLRGFYFSGMRLVPRAGSILDTTSIDHSVVKTQSDATVFFRSSSKSTTLDYSVLAKSSNNTTMPKWTFLTETFREIILGDPAGKVAPASLQIGDSKYLNIALGGIGFVFLILSVIWVFAWQRNHTLLTQVQAAVFATRTSTTLTQTETVPELESLRPLMVRMRGYSQSSKPLSYRWGLYSGDRAASDLDSLYFTRFRQAILDPTVYAMSGHFLELDPNAPVTDDVYKELKTYRTITSGSCKTDEELVASTMLPVWSDAVSRDPEAQALADKQIHFYTNELKIADPYRKLVPEDREAVLKAQIYLQGLTGPGKILQALLNEARQEPAEHLSSYASNYGQVLSGPEQMDGPYTTAGWNTIEASIRDHKLNSSGESCVVGSNRGVAGWGDSTVDAQVQKLYRDSYTQSWKQFLEGHHVIPFADPVDAAQKLRTLADNNRSPLLALVFMTSTNTNVAIEQSLRDRASDGIRSAAVGTTNKVKDLFNKLGGSKNSPAQPAVISPSQPDTPLTVRAAFDPVHAMVEPGSRDKWLNDKNAPYVKALLDLGDALQMLPAQVHNDVPLETQELQQAKGAASSADAALHALAANFPNTPTGIDVDLQNLLREPIDLARRTISAVAIVKTPAPTVGGPVIPVVPVVPVPPPVDPSVQLRLKATIRQVNTSAIGLCSAMAGLQKKFPFDATSTTDATLDDLSLLLQPGTGAYPEFSALPDVSKTYNHAGRIWAAKPDFAANYSQPFLITLNSLGEVEDELYGAGSPTAHVDLTLTVDGTGKIPFEIDVDGHTLKYIPGKAAPPLRLVWPPITTSPTRLVLKNHRKDSNLPTAQWTGPWGLYHLLQAADAESGNVFTFSTVQFAHSMIPLTNEKGVQGTIQIRVDSAASNIFGKGYFSKLRCSETWALQGQSPVN